MDVTAWKSRLFFSFIGILLIAPFGCGNHYDDSTEAGREASIADANNYLSHGQCQDALNSINSLYGSPYVDDEIRLVEASAYACFAGFNMFNLVADLANSGNFFNNLALSQTNLAGNGSAGYMYNAIDALTAGNTLLSAGSRSQSVNTYMVFLQLGILGVLERTYGNPDGSGNKQTNIVYPSGNMSNVDGCAMAAAFSAIVDSFGNSNITDANTQSAVNTLNATCVTAMAASCTVINRDRTACNGVNAASVTAGAVVSAVNAAW